MKKFCQCCEVHVYTKNQWNEIVWKRAWQTEAQDWDIRTSLFKTTKTLNSISDPGRLLIWWTLGDIAPDIMRQCYVEKCM